MFGNDTLDAAALGAGAALLGGIVAGVFSLITAWMGNKSKRAEMAFEKRLDVFTKIVEIITTMEEMRVIIVHYRQQVQEYMDDHGCDYEDEVDKELLKVYRKSVLDFYEQSRILYNTYHKFSIFIPKNIAQEIKKYQNQYNGNIDVISNHNTTEIVDEVLSKKADSKVITTMREYIGLK